jgi:hypothetical protein
LGPAREIFARERWSAYADESDAAAQAKTLWWVSVYWPGNEDDYLFVDANTSHTANREMLDYILSLFDAYLPADAGAR